MNPLTFGWHVGDVVIQSLPTPRWFRIIYALIGVAGNVGGAAKWVN